MLSPSIHCASNTNLFFGQKDFKKNSKTENKRKSLILELVRVGNSQSIVKTFKNVESFEYKKVVEQNVEEKCSFEQMMAFCQSKLRTEPKLISRNFIQLENSTESHGISVMQWNILSQALGTYHDRFDSCTTDELRWSKRRWKIVLEILNLSPIDIICMQEVDCFDFLIETLSKLGYGGIFVPKPDSPCNYIANNSGPDGCAIFWKLNRFNLIKFSKRILKVYQYPSNQVALCCQFRHNESGHEFCVATTHLKARKGPILSAFRNEQGKDLLNFLLKKCKNMPLILTGDFNAEPNEAVYKTIVSKLLSSYKEGLHNEPIFTTWTKREGEKELKSTLDYIFFSKEYLKVTDLLSLESEKLVKPIPNTQYPSDHISLVSRFKFIDN